MHKKIRQAIAAVVITSAGLTTAAAEIPPRNYYNADVTVALEAPILSKAPSLEKFDPSEWAETLHFPVARRLYGVEITHAEPRRAEAWLGATEKAIYLAVRSELPPGGAKSLLNQKRNAVHVLKDDTCEFFVNADPGAKDYVIYQAMVAAGRMTLNTHPFGEGKPAANGEKLVTFRSFKNETDWVTVVRFDLALWPGRKLTDGAWGLSMTRDWHGPFYFSCFTGDFMGRRVKVRFSKRNPGLSFAFKRAPHVCNGIEGTLKVVNGAEKRDYHYRFNVSCDTQPDMLREGDFTLAPHEVKEIPYAGLNVSLAKTYSFDLKLSSGSTDLYDQRWNWFAPFDEPVWDALAAKPLPFDFRLAFYPTTSRLRVAQILSSYKGTLPGTVTFAVNDPSGLEVARQEFPAKDGNENWMDLPQLTGTNTVTMFVGKEKLSRSFERNRFDWEGNTLGKSRTVYPPFTPIRLEKSLIRPDRLDVVLREHTLSGNGLLRQVKATGKDLLAAPIELYANGEKVKGKLSYGEVAADRVETFAQLKARNFIGSAKGVWEFDGCLKYVLRLEKGRLESLVLDIPLTGEQATMIHALGRMRFTAYAKLSEKDGVIWDSFKVGQDSFPSFSPYVYLGNPHRGLAFFAENDCGWSWDRKTSNVQVVREGGIVHLKAHLVNVPVDLASPREITLGLMAAPSKPRAKDWRAWYRRDRIQLYACDGAWLGGEGNCGSVTPIGAAAGDMRFWEYFRDTHEDGHPAPSEAFVRELKEKALPQHYAIYGESGKERVQANLWQMKFMPDAWRNPKKNRPLFYYNRSTWNNCTEYRTFMNEWGNEDWPERGRPPDTHEVGVHPTETYLDYAAWWWKKSFSYANNGIYCDNVNAALTFNRSYPGVYAEADGSIVPAAGLWCMRAYSKRVWQLLNECRMRPLVWQPHMTSTGILPVLSFCTTQLDWEWKYGEGPCQTRFPVEYLQLVSNGELWGAECQICDDSKYKGDELLNRSFFGVARVHDVHRNHGGGWIAFEKRFASEWEPDEELETVRYWDEGELPVKLESSGDVKWILHAHRGQRAMMFLVNYTSKDVTCKVTVDLARYGLADAALSDFETGAAEPFDGKSFTVRLTPWGVKAVSFGKDGK